MRRTGRKRKRSEIISSEPPHKRRRLNPISLDICTVNDTLWTKFNTMYKPLIRLSHWQRWVSATAVKNYNIKDPSIDWIHLHYKNKNHCHINRENAQLSILFKMGNKFESTVINYIRKKYPTKVKRVANGKDDIYKMDSANITLKYMQNCTFGAADILVRSDWINRLFDIHIISESEKTLHAPKLKGQYHYLVIDIKWSTMHLCSNGTTIRNSQLYPAYKGQLAIYTAALGQLQGYTPNKAYIMTKSWKYTTRGTVHTGHSCFDLLGVVDYSGFDKKWLDTTHDAIKWIRDVRCEGSKWSYNPPTRKELYPNMCNKYDVPYHRIKQEIADELDELTQIWMVGVKHREQAHASGVYRWSDPKCNSKVLGMRGPKLGPVVDKILEINRSNSKLILPDKVHNNDYGWQTKSNIEYFVDFETISGCFYNTDIDPLDSKTDNHVIFMIGVGYFDREWKYKTFSMKYFSIQEEKRVIQEFIDFISRGSIPSLYHWGHAEQSMFKHACMRHKLWFDYISNKAHWIDMCKIFKDEPIVIHGVKGFGLKGVARAMHRHGWISTEWDTTGPGSGLAAMHQAIEYYKFIDRYSKIDTKTYLDREMFESYVERFNKIVAYNEVDCKVLWEILTYIRTHHT